MSIEITHLNVKPGSEAEFIRVFTQKVAALLRNAGATDIRLYRSQENPAAFAKTTVWKSREARAKEFVNSPLFGEFRGLLVPFLDGPPSLDDYDTVFEG